MGYLMFASPKVSTVEHRLLDTFSRDTSDLKGYVMAAVMNWTARSDHTDDLFHLPKQLWFTPTDSISYIVDGDKMKKFSFHI